jgi:uncharacterized phosphosugar-binding protein
MRPMTQYFGKVTEMIARIHEQEQEPILKAAAKMKEQIKQDKLIYVFGPGGHSNLGAEEIFFRAGGLFHVSAMLDDGINMAQGALRSLHMERTPGYAVAVMNYYDLQPGDLLIIVNAYGINSATIDTALEAKKRGVFTIGVTSVVHASSIPKDHPARHPSQGNLFELVDICIDSKVPVGDAVVQIGDFPQKVSSISTFCNAFILNSLVAETVHALLEEGIHPPVWMSANAPGGDAMNKENISKFRTRIKKL